jgi:membrane fusion protein, multidrug efflux system
MPHVTRLFLSMALVWQSQMALVHAQTPPALKTVTVGAPQSGPHFLTDATVEAVRDARIASQVPGRIVALPVRAGDRVQAGQVLAQIDPSVIQQQVAGSQAQLAQAQAQAVVARNEANRARQLFAKSYLSQAALDQAEAQAKAADAQVRAMQAQVAAASAQASLHVLKAPFAGWVAQVAVSLGDAANPGQPLMQVYDPSALRITAQVPESLVPRLQRNGAAAQGADTGATLTLSGLAVEVLPAVDPATRTVTVRVPLPTGVAGLTPGQSIKLDLPLTGQPATPTPQRLDVPREAVVTRGELTGVYVVGADGQARLRQVRLGRAVGAGAGATVEVLSGLNAGERVALDPVAAARDR